MKFKKPIEYPHTVQPMQTAIEETIVPLAPGAALWECIVCDQRAIVMHKGTGYCRGCYDRRNSTGTLIS